MAAPADKTTKNLSGKWVLNKELSDSAEPGLSIQGIGYLVRKGVGLATITIDVNQYEAPPKAPSTADGTFTHIDIEQSASGLSSTKEARCLDDLPRDHSDWLFGNVKGQSSWVSVDDITDEYLKKGWLSEGDGKTLIRSHVVSQDNGWTATQIWGFQDINGERRYCRNIVIAKGDQRAEFRFVYNYEG
ncbi:LCCL domain-containing protein [Purpureocillium lilacinum]|uniref:LCCL domain-containing protein n=1 Tax=Purpureocillium lilacinum TaxID=33203 RepID=A0A179HP61_PURLI|nr:LCCL domain-containing protein [Purpureocillium lilacinum]KAK4086658.1 hypothetical protein Purlil1_9048 [Purpureocillium lilacinum]OAQ91642.1 LCCL domain-containing protein [Purpureocillium lilacinum]PWI65188.1 hypothetical protein PCL_07365 [Purpureocillium lilacinum]